MSDELLTLKISITKEDRNLLKGLLKEEKEKTYKNKVAIKLLKRMIDNHPLNKN